MKISSLQLLKCRLQGCMFISQSGHLILFIIIVYTDILLLTMWSVNFQVKHLKKFLLNHFCLFY